MNIFTKIGNFFKEVRDEIKQINWPTRQETIKYSLIVIGISIAIALFLGGLDVIFHQIVEKFILKL